MSPQVQHSIWGELFYFLKYQNNQLMLFYAYHFDTQKEFLLIHPKFSKSAFRLSKTMVLFQMYPFICILSDVPLHIWPIILTSLIHLFDNICLIISVSVPDSF